MYASFHIYIFRNCIDKDKNKSLTSKRKSPLNRRIMHEFMYDQILVHYISFIILLQLPTDGFLPLIGDRGGAAIN